MAVIWMEGFDHYGASLTEMVQGAWAAVGSTFNFYIGAPGIGARTGSYALMCEDGGDTYARRNFGADFDELYIGFGLYLSSLPPNAYTYYPAMLKNSGNTAQTTVTVGADGSLVVRDGDNKGTVVAQTAGPVLIAGAWQHVEVYVNRLTGDVQIRVNENEVLNVTSVSIGTSSYAMFQYGRDTVSFGVLMGIDDITVCDTTGTYNNSWMGDVRVATIFPTEDDLTGWTSRPIQNLGTGVMQVGVADSDRDGACYTPDNAALELGSGDFAIEAFIRPYSLPETTEEYVIASKWYAGGDARSWRLYLSGPSSGGALIFEISTDGAVGTVSQIFKCPWRPDLNTWAHVAVCRESGVTRLFIDGRQVSVDVADTNTYYNGVASMAVGAQMAGASASEDNKSFDGFIDAFRLTTAARYTANFTPPSAPLPGSAVGDPFYNDTQAILNFDNDPTFDQSQNNLTYTYRDGAATIEPGDGSYAYQVVDDPDPVDYAFIEAAYTAARGVLTMPALPLATEQVVVGSATYTFVTTLVSAFDVLIGAGTEESLDNLAAAINAGPGEGTVYGTGTTANADAISTVTGPINLEASAITAGTAGNSIASTTTVTGASWGAATFQGGTDIPGPSSFVMGSLPYDATSVTAISMINRGFKIGSGPSDVVVSFVTAADNAADGATRAMTLSPAYREDIVEQDPNTLGALTPSTLVGSKIKINRVT